jgi:hypothetical protein
MLEGFGENHHNSREPMTAAMPAQVVRVPAATLSRYEVTDDTQNDGENHIIGVTTDASALWFDHDGKAKNWNFRRG